MPEPFCRIEPPDDVSREFVQAVKSRRFKRVDELLSDNEELRKNIDLHWFDFDSPAIVSANKSEEMVKVLLKHGANINVRSSWWAGSFGVLDGVNAQMAQFLIERGAKFDIHSAAEQGKLALVQEFIERDPSLVNALGGDGQTPLHVAATIPIVNLLLDNGADAHIRCLDHSATAVQYSVSNPEKCRHLITRGSTPDIFLACAIGDRELVEQVLQTDPESLSTRVGSCQHTGPIEKRSHNHIYCWKLLGAATPLDVARVFDHAQIYEELFRRSPAKQQFLAACWDGDRDKVESVLKTSAIVFSELNDFEQKEMARAAWDGRLESVRLMLEYGFDPHLPGDENSTPLDRAAFHGHREIVELLLEKDPDPPLEFKNAHGGTPLSCCAYGSVHGWKQNTDYVGTAEALINAGAKLDISWQTKSDELTELFKKHLH